MSSHSSGSEVIDEPPDDETRVLGLPLPVREEDLFKHSATPHILSFLSDNPDVDLSIRQLTQVTPVSERATREAVNALEANDLVKTVYDGNARRVHINRSRLTDTTDPIRAIPQTHFQLPVRVACQYIEEELDDVKGIILFGSVARGTADRQSDIDLWVLVGGDHMEQRHAANKLVSHLEELSIPQTIPVPDADTADIDRNWPELKEILETDGQSAATAERYSFQILVETSQSIIGQADRVDAEQVFGQGITVRSSEPLERVKIEVLDNE